MLRYEKVRDDQMYALTSMHDKEQLRLLYNVVDLFFSGFFVTCRVAVNVLNWWSLLFFSHVLVV